MEPVNHKVTVNVQTMEYADISTILADPRNVKRHPETQLRQLEAQITDCGFNDPIAFDQNGVIVEGHGRLLAAQRLGMTEVPCIRLHFESDHQRRAYAIAHNQTQQLSPMDQSQVMSEFDRMGIGSSRYESIGFTPEDVAFMAFERGAVGGGVEADDEGEASSASTSPNNVNAFRAAPVLRSLIKFDTQDQLLVWYAFLDWIRTLYPNAQTIAERVDLFVQEYGSLSDE
jgi:hypothetical protein